MKTMWNSWWDDEKQETSQFQDKKSEGKHSRELFSIVAECWMFVDWKNVEKRRKHLVNFHAKSQGCCSECFAHKIFFSFFVCDKQSDNFSTRSVLDNSPDGSVKTFAALSRVFIKSHRNGIICIAGAVAYKWCRRKFGEKHFGLKELKKVLVFKPRKLRNDKKIIQSVRDFFRRKAKEEEKKVTKLFTIAVNLATASPEN